MSKNVAVYVRYSDELCSPNSIEDQLYRCNAYAEKEGWRVVSVYSDREISGQTAGARPEFQRMRADAARGRQFEVVLAEAPDRLARRTADLTDLRDVLAFNGVELYAVSLGLITPAYAAVMGMVAEQYSRDLGDKTKRGQQGATRRGRVAAGVAYGYRAADAEGCNRIISPREAEIVVRIFEEFANGVAPNVIAARLNAEGVPGPRDGWIGTTIRGDATRQTGILRNRIYVGEIVYGRTIFRKDPRSGKRLSSVATAPMVVTSAPALRIVSDSLWRRVQDRFEANGRKMARDESGQALNRVYRAQYVLSGLLECSCCGGAYAIMGKNRYGCSTRKNKGTCDNKTTITRQALESRVLAGIKRGLLAPELVEGVVARVTEQLAARRATARSDDAGLRRRHAEVTARISRLLDQMEDGVGDASALRTRLKERDVELCAIEEKLAQIAAEAPTVVTLPNFAQAYADQVRRLENVLRDPAVVQRAHETLARMIDKIILTPDDDAEHGMRIDIHGQVAGILQLCASKGEGDVLADIIGPTTQLSVVAGAGFGLWRTRVLVGGQQERRPDYEAASAACLQASRRLAAREVQSAAPKATSRTRAVMAASSTA